MRPGASVGKAPHRYVLGELLGTGATGAVYAATGADRGEVAIKILHPKWCDVPEVVARFTREAKVALRIDSAFVARVIAVGRSGGAFWIAYERFRGETLAQRLKREGRLSFGVASRLLEHVLSGLRDAHAAGVIHRDIKPENIFVEQRPEAVHARILDFGVSKIRGQGSGSAEQPLTTANETLGTLTYMPPEQISGAAGVDARADLYAAGVVAFRMIAGCLPFLGESPAVIVHEKLHAGGRSLRERTGAGWPDALERFLARAIACEPADRFPSALAMLESWKGVFARCAGQLPEGLGLTGAMAACPTTESTVIDDEASGEPPRAYRAPRNPASAAAGAPRPKHRPR